MTVQTTYPGVYIEEAPSGVRTIVGVTTSVTAFVGAAPRGPPTRRYACSASPTTRARSGRRWTRPGRWATPCSTSSPTAEPRPSSSASPEPAPVTPPRRDAAGRRTSSRARPGAGAWANPSAAAAWRRGSTDADTANPADLFNLVVRLALRPAHRRVGRHGRGVVRQPLDVAGAPALLAQRAAGVAARPRRRRRRPTSTAQATSTGASLGAGDIDLTAGQSRLRVSVDFGAADDLVVGPFSGDQGARSSTALGNAAAAAGLAAAASTASNATADDDGTGGAGRAVTVTVGPAGRLRRRSRSAAPGAAPRCRARPACGPHDGTTPRPAGATARSARTTSCRPAASGHLRARRARLPALQPALPAGPAVRDPADAPARPVAEAVGRMSYCRAGARVPDRRQPAGRRHHARRTSAGCPRSASTARSTTRA